MFPQQRGGGHTVFGADPFEIADCLWELCTFCTVEVWLPVFVLFCEYFLENVEKKFTVGVLERVGVITVNIPYFFYL